MSTVRALIVAGERSQARIVETYVGRGGGTYFTNAVTEVVAGDGAIVDHYKVQQESRDGVSHRQHAVHAGRSASFSSHSFSLGGALVAQRRRLRLLDGEGGDAR